MADERQTAGGRRESDRVAPPYIVALDERFGALETGQKVLAADHAEHKIECNGRHVENTGLHAETNRVHAETNRRMATLDASIAVCSNGIAAIIGDRTLRDGVVDGKFNRLWWLLAALLGTGLVAAITVTAAAIKVLLTDLSTLVHALPRLPIQ